MTATPITRPATEPDAYKLLESVRWPGGHPEKCPHCGGIGRAYFLTPKDGTEGRKTRTGSISERRLWVCGHCRMQFSVLTNSVLEGTKVPIATWVNVILDLCGSKRGRTSREIADTYGITRGTAWRVLALIATTNGGEHPAALVEIFPTDEEGNP